MSVQVSARPIESMLASKRKMISEAFWVVFSLGGKQGIRLLGNLVLTRLLQPELFGIMVIVNAFIIGANMFSDVGIRSGVITSDRAEQKPFLDTAWTLQLIRGVVIYGVLIAIAYPVELMYDVDGIATVLMVTGSTTLIASFASVNVFVEEKKLAMKRIAIIDFASQVLGLLCLIALAWWWRNIWALAIGSLAAMVFRTWFSYQFISGATHALGWDKPSVSEIFRYGKWILFSTMGLFLTIQGDRLLLGHYMTMETLGIYSVAITFAMMFTELAESVATRFLFPVYRRMVETKDESAIHVRNLRAMTLAIGLLACLPLVGFGDYLVRFLYDERYHAAGWMLQILVVASLLRMFDATLRPILLANRNSFLSMVYQFVTGASLILALYFGAEHYGMAGIMIAIIVAPIISQLALLVLVRRYGYRWALFDIAAMSVVLLVVWGIWSIVPSDPLSMLQNAQSF
ncbi:oligosaccharide flippase family protein [Marinibactrum halimedae]|uniref:Lipopolysaccharide biosynthesis protein n=1 Tax=Marinibactrum halimedae TaxID=1444977 RepID=A0AA37WKI5_9GAMM|nr:oligosaccharide flippase family protein [Marinibactrum halimedae]MCD9459759.1 oligosaccharide flippase family protein [Marinibactrum halimedae]GLS24484.1 lipopolysaccharide biosynthesis protein [Marinibactrum halimedae]